MSKPLLDIQRLNQERYGTDFSFGAADFKLREELEEFSEANTADDIDGMVDALADIIVIAAGELTKLGYSPELVLKQTIKEISSRNQDPTQRRAWESGNREPGEKWLKHKQQDPDTLYTANYGVCKL